MIHRREHLFRVVLRAKRLSGTRARPLLRFYHSIRGHQWRTFALGHVKRRSSLWTYRKMIYAEFFFKNNGIA